MVVERFRTPGARDVYRRSRDNGRMLPDGLRYVASWVDMDFSRCYQLMETENRSLFKEWTRQWEDLVEFEIIPVRLSSEAMDVIRPTL